MNNISKADCLLSLYSNPKPHFSLIDDGIESVLHWHDSRPEPTEAEIKTQTDLLQAEYDSQEYARNRVAEYPSQGDQNDMIYKDNLNGTTTHKDAVEAVKTKWPKNNTAPVE